MHKDIVSCIEVLKRGGTIVYPTDTIWGIGCDATNEEAVEKVYRLKKREDAKSMLIIVDQINRIYNYIDIIPARAIQLINGADKPLTVIFQGAKNLAKNLVNQDGSIGIRVTKDIFCKELISNFNKPIVSTSANESGKPYPKCFSEIDKNLLLKVDYVVKWKQDDKKPAEPSDIIKINSKGDIENIR